MLCPPAQLPTSSPDPDPDSADGGPEIYPCSPSYFVPYFTVAISLIELMVYLFHVIYLSQKYCMEFTASGPYPLCSVLIYDPERRYEVSENGYQ